MDTVDLQSLEAERERLIASVREIESRIIACRTKAGLQTSFDQVTWHYAQLKRAVVNRPENIPELIILSHDLCKAVTAMLIQNGISLPDSYFENEARNE